MILRNVAFSVIPSSGGITCMEGHVYQIQLRRHHPATRNVLYSPVSASATAAPIVRKILPAFPVYLWADARRALTFLRGGVLGAVGEVEEALRVAAHSLQTSVSQTTCFDYKYLLRNEAESLLKPTHDEQPIVAGLRGGVPLQGIVQGQSGGGAAGAGAGAVVESSLVRSRKAHNLWMEAMREPSAVPESLRVGRLVDLAPPDKQDISRGVMTHVRDMDHGAVKILAHIRGLAAIASPVSNPESVQGSEEDNAGVVWEAPIAAANAPETALTPGGRGPGGGGRWAARESRYSCSTLRPTTGRVGGGGGDGGGRGRCGARASSS